MSSRFPPINPGDQRYGPRDRSPPRFAERRVSTQHGGSLGSRAPDPGSRNLEDNGPPNLHRDLPREPPRGPKGFVDGPRGGAHIPGGPRGRGFAGRGDFRDRDRERERDFRESRDLRDDAPFRRENDREWPRRDRDFETRESRPSPPARARSRTPPGRGFRDLRDGQPRDLDLSRIRRDSRDAPLSATSTASDPPISTGGGFTRGGFRGRGRGDWDFRGRGRGTFLDDREGYRARSDSQDRRWDRDSRDDRERERVVDRRDDRRADLRDDERKLPDRVERERDAERWKREQGVNRVESRNPSGSSTAPSTPLAPSAGNLHLSGTERLALKDGFLGPVSDRRASSAVVSSIANRDIRRDVERSDYFTTRAEASRERYGPRASSPPPQAPQVPAFGSVTNRSMPGAGFGTNVWRAPKDERSAPVSTVSKAVPTGPKAQVTLQAPTGPRADLSVDRRQAFESKDQVNRGTNNPRFKDIHHPSRTESTPAMISATAQVVDISSNPPWGPRSLDNHAPPTAPSRATPSAAQAMPRPALSSSPQPPIRPSYTTPVRAVTPGGPPRSASAATPNGSTTSPRPFNTPIPTGPRAGKTIPPSRPQPQSRPTAPSALFAQGSPKAHQWVRSAPPKYPKVPSIMNTVPAKRDRAGEEKDRSSRTTSSVTRAEPPPWDSITAYEITPPDSQAPKLSDQVSRYLSPSVKMEDPVDESKNSPASGTSSKDKPTINGPGSIGLNFDSDGSSDEADDDDDMDLDEEDFADRESRFAREMAILEAKKPAPPRYGTTRVMEILKIISLEDLADNYGKSVVLTGSVPEDVANATRQSQTGLPSPERDNSSDVEMEDAASALREVPMNRIPTPAIESLPFLNAGPPTPFSELGVVQENNSNYEKVKEAIRAEILKQRNQVAKKHKQLRQEYAALYKPWRMMVQELDNKKKEEKTITPAPTSPTTATSPTVASTPLIEGRRGGKFGTEFDLQRVLRESELAAKEAAEREEREAKAKTDTEKEAAIPDMLDEFEAEAGVFKDTNQFVDAKLALGVFAFVPPVDDFTPEEQKIFTENFLAYPKKWGKIAEALPGRDYKQCIEHYYLTKEESKYKVKLNRRWSKKGRRAGRAPQSRPKSNALMSDLGVHPEMYDGDEPDAPTIAVTDTGRPKRAAAPTFGDNAVETDPTPVPTPGRKPVVAKGEVNLESNVERPTPKRTKTVHAREKGPKRGKAPLLAAAPGPSPQKSEREGSRGKSREPKIEDEQKAKDLEVASSLASLLAGPVTTQVSQSESWFTQAQPLAGHSDTTRQQQQQKPASQTSSYWSVPEQTDFIKLLAHFGTDWPAIANWMKSKTHTMAKNYYFRLVEQGRTDLEDMAREADDKRRRGEPLGPPPPPTVVQKRRYEITPQSAQHRPLAPNSDVMEVEDLSPNVVHAVPIQGSPQQYNQAPPRLATLAQAAPAPTLAISQTPFQKSVQGPNQVQPQAQHKAPQGPRIGFFPDDRKDNRLSGQMQSMSMSSMSQQQSTSQKQLQQQQLQQQQQQQQQLEQQQLQAQLEQQQQQRQQQILEQQQRQQQLEQQRQQQLEQQRLQQAEQQRQQQSEQQRQHMQQQLQQLEQQGRAARIQQRAQESQSRYPKTLQNQQQLPVQQNYPASQPTKSVVAVQSRSGPSEAIQIEPRPRLNLHQQHTEPPTCLRRLDSYEQQKQYMQSPIRSPAVAGPVVAPLSARDEPRPGPLPGGVIGPELARPPQVPVKRSNIMSILNDEPTEPSPRKRISDQKVLAPTPPSHSPAPQNVRYHPPQPQSQQSQHTVRKDAPIDQPVVQSQQRPSFGLPNQPQPQQTPVRTYPELSASWPTVVHNRTYYDPRPTYQPQRVPSPQVQGAHVQPSRPTYQHTRAPSPAPPVFNSHSRSSSYTQIPQQQPAPSYPLQQSSYPVGPQHQQLHHHAPNQHLPLQQQQQTSSLRQDMQQQRMQQDHLRQQQQQQQMLHEQARQDQMRREQQAQAGGRTFTPPAGGDYRPSSYGVPVPRGYQERR